MKKEKRETKKEVRFKIFNSMFMFIIIVLLTIIATNMFKPINVSGGDYVMVETFNNKIIELEAKIQELENRISEIEQSVVRNNNKIDKIKNDLSLDIKANTNKIDKANNREYRFYEGILEGKLIKYVTYSLYREIK